VFEQIVPGSQPDKTLSEKKIPALFAYNQMIFGAIIGV
jgi:hypothetical protein